MRQHPVMKDFYVLYDTDTNPLQLECEHTCCWASVWTLDPLQSNSNPAVDPTLQHMGSGRFSEGTSLMSFVKRESISNALICA